MGTKVQSCPLLPKLLVASCAVHTCVFCILVTNMVNSKNLIGTGVRTFRQRDRQIYLIDPKLGNESLKATVPLLTAKCFLSTQDGSLKGIDSVPSGQDGLHIARWTVCQSSVESQCIIVLTFARQLLWLLGARLYLRVQNKTVCQHPPERELTVLNFTGTTALFA